VLREYFYTHPLTGLRDSAGVVVPLIIFLIISLVVHEVAHGWVALKRGDTTARDMGRLTLNPIPHIDPVMTLLVPGLLLLVGSPVLFGGARPVPVDMHRLRNPWRDMTLVALAGPLSNFGLAFVFATLWRVAVEQGWGGGWNGNLAAVLAQSAFFNLVLGFFNLVPIPPLDGSRLLAYVLPGSLRGTYVGLEHIGLLLVFALVWFGALNIVLFPALDFGMRVLDGFLGLW
jgi:Zn-dependent protease